MRLRTAGTEIVSSAVGPGPIGVVAGSDLMIRLSLVTEEFAG
jgi:hypothetical protein